MNGQEHDPQLSLRETQDMKIWVSRCSRAHAESQCSGSTRLMTRLNKKSPLLAMNQDCDNSSVHLGIYTINNSRGNCRSICNPDFISTLETILHPLKTTFKNHVCKNSQEIYHWMSINPTKVSKLVYYDTKDSASDPYISTVSSLEICEHVCIYHQQG